MANKRIIDFDTIGTSSRSGMMVPCDKEGVGVKKFDLGNLALSSDVTAETTARTSADNALQTSFNSLDGFQTTSAVSSLGSLTDNDTIAINSAFFGYAVPVKNLVSVSYVVFKDIRVAESTGDDTTCTLEIVDSSSGTTYSTTATLSTSTIVKHNYDVKFTFNSAVSIETGYMRISCPIKISYADNRNSTMGAFFDSSRVGQYLSTYGGSWTNLTTSQTLQFSQICEFFGNVVSKASRISLLCKNKVIKFVSSATELVSVLEEAGANATSTNWYEIHIASGEYNLLPFIDLSKITSVTATGYRGIEVPSYTRLIGDATNRPHIYVDLTEEETTTEQQWTVSALNLKNTAELYNLVISGKQCRYAVHDDGGNSAFVRYCENCKFVHYQNTASVVWNQQTAYGNGLYKGCKETFVNCEFIAYHEGIYIHDNPTYNVSSDVVLDNCRFETLSKPQSAKFQAMGASAITTIKIKDCSFNAPIKKQIDDSENDSMTIEGWKNSLDTTLGVEIVNA